MDNLNLQFPQYSYTFFSFANRTLMVTFMEFNATFNDI